MSQSKRSFINRVLMTDEMRSTVWIVMILILIRLTLLGALLGEAVTSALGGHWASVIWLSFASVWLVIYRSD